jgi:Domain of unknown function (DUF4492)
VQFPAPRRIFAFYVDGFRQMTLGRTLWLLIAIKALVIFGVIKLIFLPDFLSSRFDTDQAKADYVLEQMTSAAADQDPQGDLHDD